MINPEWCHVRYRILESCGSCGRDVDVRLEVGETYEGDGLELRFLYEGDVVEVRALSRADVRVQLCHLGFERVFAPHERILLNGYQSWTDTAERSTEDFMKGLERVNPRFVRHYVLDGGGDYAFAQYERKPGKMHGYTYATVRDGDRYDLLGSLGEEDGFTMIVVDAAADSVQVRRECDATVLAAGEKRALCRLALTSGGVDQAYDRWFELMGVRALPASPLVGYSSWYRHYGDIDEDKIADDLQGACAAFDSLSCEGARKVFQIDDGYCEVGDWTHPSIERFPRGLAFLAERIREAGFVPGLWVAPFVCERQSRIGREHPDWILRNEKGVPVRSGSHWSGAFALDTLNPAVRQHVRDSLRTITAEWGFEFLKVDFLYAACIEPHGGMNRGQLMADALDLVRDAVGPDVALLGCGVPLGSAFGKVEYCRIGCDVGLDWDDKPHMRQLHRERISTKNSLANTVFRAPLDGRAFANDPDVFFLRNDVNLSAQRKEDLLAADACFGSALLTSDHMGAWGERERSLYQAAIDVLCQRA